MPIRTKDLVLISILAALAFITTLFVRVPIMPAAPFLDYDPKDITIVIGGFLFGPLPALAMAFIVAFLEMVTVSAAGPIGMLMNTLSSAAFACTAAMIYKHKHNLPGAVVGLVAGCAMAVAVMLLWNYIVTPIYMGVPREVVTAMLLPVFFPFNLIKYILNASAAMILYKPVAIALRASGARDGDTMDSAKRGKPNLGVLLVSTFVIISTLFLILALQGRI